METAIAVKTDDFDRKAVSVLEQARSLRVVDEPSFESAGQFLTGLRDLKKELDETFDEAISAAFTAHKKSVAAKARHFLPVVEAEKLVKEARRVFFDASEVKRLELERQRNAELQKQAEDEALRAAEAAEKDGRKAEADVILSTPQSVAPFVAPKLKIAGKDIQKYYGAVVDDLSLLVLAVAESIKAKDGRYPLNFLEPGQAALNARARSDKESFRIPGVRLVVK